MKIPRSYWQTTVPTFELPYMMPTTADIVVVGGGLLGICTAYWLAQQTKQSIVLLEKTAIGHGATGRNGGFVVTGAFGSFQRALQMVGVEITRYTLEQTMQSQQLLQEVLLRENIHCQYREIDMLHLLLTEVEQSQIIQGLTFFHGDYFPATILDRVQVQQYLHMSLTDRVIGARILAKQATLHPAQFLQGLLSTAILQGVQAYHSEVLEINTKETCIQLLTTQGMIQTGQLFIATNAHIGQLVPELANVITPAREQMVAFQAVQPLFHAGLSARVETAEYWQQRPDGTIVLGGCSSHAPNNDSDTWDDQPTNSVQTALEHVLPQVFHGLPPLKVIQRWAGTLDRTADRLPIVDTLVGNKNCYYATGFSGNGMPYGMILGQLIATSMLQGHKRPELNPYQLNRPTLQPL